MLVAVGWTQLPGDLTTGLAQPCRIQGFHCIWSVGQGIPFDKFFPKSFMVGISLEAALLLFRTLQD